MRASSPASALRALVRGVLLAAGLLLYAYILIRWPALNEGRLMPWPEFVGWMLQVARRYLARRVDLSFVPDPPRAGTLHAVVATTVVEVGVDVPNATIMVVEHPERFGLSQLHQLRGRVGRSDRPAWCILFADENPGEEAAKRLEVMCRTNDGFEIARSRWGWCLF